VIIVSNGPAGVAAAGSFREHATISAVRILGGVVTRNADTDYDLGVRLIAEQ